MPGDNACLEPHLVVVEASLASIATSLRRIADKLEVLGSSQGLFRLAAEVKALVTALEDR